MLAALKNKFVIILIVAIISGGIVGWFLLRAEKANAPEARITPTQTGAMFSSGEKISPVKIFQKLDEFTKD